MFNTAGKLPNVVYDLTRLATRFSRRTPNGIDRVDLEFARRYVTFRHDQVSLLLTILGPRLVPNSATRTVVEAVEEHWREQADPNDDPAFVQLKQQLVGEIKADGAQAPGSVWTTLRSIGRLTRKMPLVGADGLFPGLSPSKYAPKGAIYLNVSQFPLWVEPYFRWLRQRPDVKAVFMVHDLLPLTYPEFFPEAEYKRHQARLRVLARIGAAAIVTSEATKVELDARLGSLGRPGLPILVLPLPAAAAFFNPAVHDPILSRQRYFVTCGTIEPRKNHLLLLQIWRELADTLGTATPKLVIVGQRGWENENTRDLMERSDKLAPHVFEVSNLSTPALKRLLDSAQALLMPSFAEGFGLPVAEAIAAGVPTMASDIAPFRVLHSNLLKCLDPVDGLGWINAIRACVDQSTCGFQRASRNQHAQPTDWTWFFEHTEEFLSGLH